MIAVFIYRHHKGGGPSHIERLRLITLPGSFDFMELKTRTIEELKKIVEKDYGVLISDDVANKLGATLLRLTRLATAALARADEKKLELVRTLPYRSK